MEIVYTEERRFTAEELRELFESVGWLSGKYPERLKKALDGCATVITAWEGERLVGLVNAIDDGELTAYAHYLCVAPDCQGKGVGKTLLSLLKKKYENYLYLILHAEHDGLIPYYLANGFTPRDDETIFMRMHESPQPAEEIAAGPAAGLPGGA